MKNYFQILRRLPGIGLIKPRGVAVLAAFAASIGLFATFAFATPGAGIISGTVFARASFVDPTDLKFKIDGGSQEVVHVANARETVVQQIIISPGGSTGWHSHPGPAVALIKAGQLSLYSSENCAARVYSAGESFVDSGQGHVHMARNEGATNVEIWVTYFDVPVAGAFRIDVPNPGTCPGL